MAIKYIKKQKKTLGVILVIGLIIPLYYILKGIFYASEMPGDEEMKSILDTFLFTILIASVLYTNSTLISNFLEKRLPWSGNARSRFFIQLVITAASTILLSAIVTYVYFKLLRDCEDIGPVIFNVTTVALVVTTIATALYEGSYLFKRWREAVVNAEKLKQENLQSQFDALKNQVNPHFLFNSLNTLATIIPEDPTQAVEFVQKLSSVYRYLLQYKDNETVDLKTELDCIAAYLFLQKIRFGENLRVNINIPDKYNYRQIPPLTLQILVENAIKHNIISAQKPLTVDIYIDDAGMLVTRNNLQKKKSVESSTKIGLENLMNRFTYIFGQGIDIFETDADFIVKVPLGD